MWWQCHTACHSWRRPHSNHVQLTHGGRTRLVPPCRFLPRVVYNTEESQQARLARGPHVVLHNISSCVDLQPSADMNALLHMLHKSMQVLQPICITCGRERQLRHPSNTGCVYLSRAGFIIMGLLLCSCCQWFGASWGSDTSWSSANSTAPRSANHSSTFCLHEVQCSTHMTWFVVCIVSDKGLACLVGSPEVQDAEWKEQTTFSNGLRVSTMQCRVHCGR
jgi:hypothetical protein